MDMCIQKLFLYLQLLHTLYLIRISTYEKLQYLLGAINYYSVNRKYRVDEVQLDHLRCDDRTSKSDLEFSQLNLTWLNMKTSCCVSYQPLSKNTSYILVHCSMLDITYLILNSDEKYRNTRIDLTEIRHWRTRSESLGIGDDDSGRLKIRQNLFGRQTITTPKSHKINFGVVSTSLSWLGYRQTLIGPKPAQRHLILLNGPSWSLFRPFQTT